MIRNTVIIAGILLIAAAVIAMPVSAGNGQGAGNCGYSSGSLQTNYNYQDCAAYSYGTGNGMAYNYRNSECFEIENSKSGEYCRNNGTDSQDCRSSAYSNSGVCPCI